MVARVLKTTVQEGKGPEATRLAKESIGPAAREQKGNRGFILLTAGDVGLSITFWETEEDMLEADQTGYLQAQTAKVASLVSGPALMEIYKVEQVDLPMA